MQKKTCVADLEARHRAADRFHDARAVAAEDGGQLVGMVGGLGAQLGVHRIHAGGGELHADMVRRGQFRLRDVAQLQDFYASGGSGEDGFHVRFSRFVDSGVNRNPAGLLTSLSV